jgi:hypothetical protein
LDAAYEQFSLCMHTARRPLPLTCV